MCLLNDIQTFKRALQKMFPKGGDCQMTLLMLQAAPLHDGSSSQWSCDVVVITTAQLNSTKAGLVLHRLNPACNMSDIHIDDGL